jgi:hypothetical protein
MPAVAGHFYPGARATLLAEVEQHLRAGARALRQKAIGCVVPHAGYRFSGHVAGAVFGALELPRRFIILCPNHTGRGRALAITSSGAWRTPLGDVPIDEALAGALLQEFPTLEEDAEAHLREHALEVELPFLQAQAGAFTFVPICVGTGRLEVLLALGEAIAAVLRGRAALPAGEPPALPETLLIASSDMNHYEPDAPTRVKDAKAIEPILALDPRRLHVVVQREHISMCGYAPTVAMLAAAGRLGATAAELIKYATSADVSGDPSAVVGYAGIVIT